MKAEVVDATLFSLPTFSETRLEDIDREIEKLAMSGLHVVACSRPLAIKQVLITYNA